MNSIVLMGEVLSDPELRFTAENLAITSLLIEFPGLRDTDPKARVRVSVFGEKAQTLKDEIQKGQQVVVEGQLRMNVVERDGRNEKRAEINAKRVYGVGGVSTIGSTVSAPQMSSASAPAPAATPDYGVSGAGSMDEIPF